MQRFIRRLKNEVWFLKGDVDIGHVTLPKTVYIEGMFCGCCIGPVQYEGAAHAGSVEATAEPRVRSHYGGTPPFCGRMEGALGLNNDTNSH